MQIVSTCIARDLPVYKETYRSLRRFLPDSEIHVIAPENQFPEFRKACGTDLMLWAEDELLPDMSLDALKSLPLPFFPRGAGWYFQQFLKYAFVGVSNDDPFYVIWDADTVLLRPLQFIDEGGRAFQTRAAEHHAPYFKTFEALFGVQAPCDHSFISQHQVIEKSLLREMLALIDEKGPATRGNTWPWIIMQHLRGEGSNLFSEYETYGNYVSWKHPERIVTRNLPWTRDGGEHLGYPPDPEKLPALGERYAFAAVEANHHRGKRIWSRLKSEAMRILGKAD